MSMCNKNLLYLDTGFRDGGFYPADITARVDDRSAVAFFTDQQRAVLLKGRDGDDNSFQSSNLLCNYQWVFYPDEGDNSIDNSRLAHAC